jgi:hypothetical protein
MNRDTFWWRLLHLNPVLFRTAVVTIVALLAMAGVLVSPTLPDTLTAAVTAIAALGGALWSRDGVTPNDKVVVYQPDPVDRPTVILPGVGTAEGSSDRAVLEAARAAPAD